MKKIPLIALFLSLSLLARAAEVPEEEDLKSLSEASLLSFGEAVKAKDFSDFYEEIASVWQKQTSADKLKTAFNDFLDKDVDIPSVVNELKPVFDPPAAINGDDLLVIKGYYPTKPNKVNFQLKYMKEEGDWKLVGIDIKLKE